MGYAQSVRWFAALLLTVVDLMACAPQAASQVNTPRRRVRLRDQVNRPCSPIHSRIARRLGR